MGNAENASVCFMSASDAPLVPKRPVHQASIENHRHARATAKEETPREGKRKNNNLRKTFPTRRHPLLLVYCSLRRRSAMNMSSGVVTLIFT